MLLHIFLECLECTQHGGRRSTQRFALLGKRDSPRSTKQQRRAHIALDRKILADLAISDPAAFEKIVQQAKAA